jgi:hypothetical protein
MNLVVVMLLWVENNEIYRPFAVRFSLEGVQRGKRRGDTSPNVYPKKESGMSVSNCFGESATPIHR